MSIVSRQSFIDEKPRLDLSSISARSWDALAAHGVDRTSLEEIAGPDSVISGAEEAGALYDLILARATGNTGADLGRAQAVYEILQSEILRQLAPIDFDFSFVSSARARTTGIFAAECSIQCHSAGDRPSEAVELFRWTLEARAIARLDDHQRRIGDESDRYRDPSDANPAWARLEEAAAKLAEIDAWEDMQRGHPSCGSGACHDSNLLPPGVADQAKLMRAKLIEAVPALAVLDSYDLANLHDRARTSSIIQSGLAEYEAQIEDVKARIGNDIPVTKLGNLVAEVMQEYGISEAARANGDPASAAVLDWLEGQERTEAFLQLSAFGGGVVLGIGAFLAPEFSVPLGLAGAGIGLGDAVYSFEIADDIYDAANATPFELEALADPEQARFDRAIALASLVMAAVDAGAAARGLTRAAGAVAPESRIASESGNATPSVAETAAKTAPKPSQLDRLALELPNTDRQLMATLLARGVDPDAIGRIAKGAGQLGDGLGNRILAYLSDKSANEVRAADEMIQIELADGGHSIARHGPHLTYGELEHRMFTALAPDGKPSPAPASTRFTSFERMLRTRLDAEQIFRARANANNWDLTKGPGQGKNPEEMDTVVTIDLGKTLGRGYVATAPSSWKGALFGDDVLMLEPKNVTVAARARELADARQKGVQLSPAELEAKVQARVNDPAFKEEFARMQIGEPTAAVYDSVENAGEKITRSATTFAFDNGKWRAVQHFPVGAAAQLDPTTGQYLNAADVMLRRP